jgi:hypothetical protein
MHRALVLVLVVLLVAACSGTGSTAVSGGTTATAAPRSEAPPAETPAAAPDATESTPEAPPAEGPVQYQPGDKITITEGGSGWAQIVVSKVETAKTYKGEYGSDVPDVKGNVYIQAYVTYTALQDGVSYNPFDWQVFADGEAVSGFTFVMYGPEPALSSGDLPKGRKASGWLVYEVPAKGKIQLSYSGNMFLNEAPVFEVVIRSK